MNIVRKIAFILGAAAAHVVAAPTRVFAASGDCFTDDYGEPIDSAVGPALAGKECALPPYRWGGVEEYIHNEDGWWGIIAAAPTALGNLLLTASGLIWQGLMWMVRIGVTFGAKIWDFLSLPVAELTALFGGQLFPVSVAVLLFTIFAGWKTLIKQIASKPLVMALLNLGRGWIIPFLLLASLVANSNTAVTNARTITDTTKKNEKVRDQVWTIPWIAHTTENITTQIAGSLSSLNTEKVMKDFASKDKVNSPTDYDCTDYINTIYDVYLGAKPSVSNHTMVSISKLWVKTHYDNVMRGQFGITQRGIDSVGHGEIAPNGRRVTLMYNLPGIVGCRAYEYWNKTPPSVQYALTKKSFEDSQPTGKKISGIIPEAEVFYAANRDQIIAAVTAWAACQPQGDGKMSARTPYDYVDHVGDKPGTGGRPGDDMCGFFFQDATYNNNANDGEKFGINQKEINIYIFGKDDHIMKILTKKVVIPATNCTAPPCAPGGIKQMTPEKYEETMQAIRPAQELAKSMSGTGWTRAIYGFTSLIVALIAMWVLGPMAAGLIVTLFMSIGLLTIGLPAALLLSAAGKPEKARPLYRSIMSSLLAKAMFLLLITVTLLLVTLLNSLILVLESHLGNGLNTLIGAFLYGVVPLLAFFVVNMMLKKVMPGANLSNPLSTAGMAFKGSTAGWGADNFKNKWNRRGKFDKDGNPIKKEPRPGSLAAKLQQSRLGQKAGVIKAQADQAVPSWRKIKKMSRLGNANELYREDREALAKKRLDHAENTNKRKAKKKEDKQYRANRKESKQDLADKLDALKKEGKKVKKAPPDEGLLNKPGAKLDAEAVKTGATMTKTPATASLHDRKTNAKANALAQEAAVADYMSDHRGCTREQAMEAVQKAKKGSVVSKEFRDTEKTAHGMQLGYTATDPETGLVYPDTATIAKSIIATDDGITTHIGNVLANPNAKGMSRDDLWDLLTQGGCAFGLGKGILDLRMVPGADGISRPETETEVAARVNTTLLSRGLVDIDGGHVNPMDILGVSKDQVHEYVNTGSTGSKDLDAVLKDYMKGNSKLFEGSDAKYEAQNNMVAQKIESERIAEVVRVGLTLANQGFTRDKAVAMLEGSVYRELREDTANRLAVSLQNVTDPAEVSGLLDDVIATWFTEAAAVNPVPAEMMPVMEAELRKSVSDIIMKHADSTKVSPAIFSELREINQGVRVIKVGTASTRVTGTSAPATDVDVYNNITKMIEVVQLQSELEPTVLAATDPADKRRRGGRVSDLHANEEHCDLKLREIHAEGAATQRYEFEVAGRLGGLSEDTIRLKLIQFDEEMLKESLEIDAHSRDLVDAVRSRNVAVVEHHRKCLSEKIKKRIDPSYDPEMAWAMAGVTVPARTPPRTSGTP